MLAMFCRERRLWRSWASGGRRCAAAGRLADRTQDAAEGAAPPGAAPSAAMAGHS